MKDYKVLVNNNARVIKDLAWAKEVAKRDSLVNFRAVVLEDGYRLIRCYGLYSATTRKHISAFAKENGLTYQDFKAVCGQPYEFGVDTGEVVFDEDADPFKK